MLRVQVLLMAAVGGLSSACLAQTTQAQRNQQPKETRDPSEIVCEKQEVLGSRLATKRVCLTRAQWADLKNQDREDIERVQVRRGMRPQ